MMDIIAKNRVLGLIADFDVVGSKEFLRSYGYYVPENISSITLMRKAASVALRGNKTYE